MTHLSEDTFTKYPHMENIDEVPGIFELPEVVVTEKVHGSAMRIGLIDGKIRMGGRRFEFENITPESKDGQGFVSWVLDTKLDQKVATAFAGHHVILFGEWHGSGTPLKGWPQIQKGIRYFKGNDFRVFDIRLNGKFVSQDELPALAASVGLKTMPILYRGKPSSEAFNALIDTVSRVGKENGIEDPENTMEGIVIRPVEMQWNADRSPVMAKYKVGKWAERASQSKHGFRTKPKEKPVIAGAKEFAEEFVTATRLEHVLDQLREANIPIDLKALGEVMKGMGQDIKREGANALSAAGLEWKDVSPFITHLTKTLFANTLKR